MAESANEAVDDLFEGEEHEISEEVIQETEAEDTSEPKGEEVEAVEKTEEVPEPPSDKEPALVPRAAMLDERFKRQNLEKEVESLRGQIPKTEEAPDPYDDLEAYDAYNREKWQQEQRAGQDKAIRQGLDDSRNNMLQQHEDYIEMERIFEVMAASDEMLIGQMMQSNDPGKFAYDTAKSYKESLFAKPEQKEEIPPSDSEIRNKSAINAPNLASATAQAPNTPQLEKEEDLMDIFEDQW